MRESSAERKLFLDQNLAKEAVLLPAGESQPRDADGDCADEVGEGFGHIVGGKLCLVLGGGKWFKDHSSQKSSNGSSKFTL